MSSGRRSMAVAVAVGAVTLAGCSVPAAEGHGGTSATPPPPTVRAGTTLAATSSTTRRPPTTPAPGTTARRPPASTATTATTATTAGPAPTPAPTPGPDLPAWPAPAPDANAPRLDAGTLDLPFLAATVTGLVDGNLGVSVTLRRDGAPIFGAAWGNTVGGAPIGTDTPFVIASVSKLVTALSIARLAEAGELDVASPVPWGEMGIWHHPAWESVTVRELLDHTSGMPVARSSWLDDPGSCAIPLTDALSRPPRSHRGSWRYSNGNYCALGLLITHVTGQPLERAADELVFDPLRIRGAHLTTNGSGPADAPYTNGARGVERLERLGGAGTWMMSTADVARMVDAVTDDDLATLRFPGVMQDQYGWGHTGTVDGAEACVWVMEGGRTVLAGVVSGNEPGSGSELCVQLESAAAVDLGFFTGVPFHTPR